MPILKNERHEKAVQAYLSNGGNQSASYRIGYPSSLKWSDKVVHNKASLLFKRGDVMVRVSELQARLEKKEILSKEAILNDLKEISTVTIDDYMEIRDEQLKIKDTKDWTKAMSRACTGIKPGKNGIELTIMGVKYAYDRISKMVGYDAPLKIEQKDTTLADLLK